MSLLRACGESVCQRWRRPWRKDISFQTAKGDFQDWSKRDRAEGPDAKGFMPLFAEGNVGAWATCAWPVLLADLRVCRFQENGPTNCSQSPGILWKAAMDLGSQAGRVTYPLPSSLSTEQ